MVLKTSNTSMGEGLSDIVKEVCREAEVEAVPIQTGLADKGPDLGSDQIRELSFRRIVLLTGEGVNANAAGAVWHFFDRQLDYPVSLIQTTDLSRMNWEATDVLVMVDGRYSFLSDKQQTEKLREWVEKGGKLVALESATSSLARLDWGLRIKKETDDENKKEGGYELLRSYAMRERDELKQMTPGSVYEVQLDPTHPLAYGYGSNYFTLKQDDRLFDFFQGNGWNVGVLKKNARRAGFVGSKLKKRLEDGLLFGVQDIGRGQVVYLSDDLLFRSFWENGKLMFCNALFFD